MNCEREAEMKYWIKKYTKLNMNWGLLVFKKKQDMKHNENI